MSKKDLLKEIDEKIKRKQELREQVADKSTIEGFVMEFMHDIEELPQYGPGPFHTLAALSKISLTDKLKRFDRGVEIDVSWHAEEGLAPQVNGVLIKWSRDYQQLHDIDPELFVDVTQLLFNSP